MDRFKEKERMDLAKQDLEEIPAILAGIRGVDVRRNKIRDVAISKDSTVQFLDISDNLISSLKGLSGAHSLEVLDAGYNLIKKVPKLDLPNLRELYLMSNDISKIENVNFKTLEKLDMANNDIRVLENMNCPNLLEAYFGANKISVLQDISEMEALRVLDLQYNMLEELDCRLIPESLEILLLQGNKMLKSIKNIGKLQRLKILGLKHTQAVTAEGIEELEIW